MTAADVRWDTFDGYRLRRWYHRSQLQWTELHVTTPAGNRYVGTYQTSARLNQAIKEVRGDK